MSFARILSRGLAVANASPWPVLFFILLFAPQLLLQVLSAELVPTITLKPGEPPGPELLLLVVLGFLTLGWFVLLFGIGPWLGGATAAQLRDRIRTPDAMPGSFVRYGNNYYVRSLLLFLMYAAVVVAVFLVSGMVGLMVAAGRIQPGQYDPAVVRELSRHPVSLALTGANWLVLTAVGVVLNLANAVLVAEDAMPWTAVARAFECGRQHIADAGKLFLTSLAVSLPLGAIQMTPVFLESPGFATGIALAVAQGLYLPYLIVLNLGIATSFYHARRSEPLEVKHTGS